MRVCAWLNSEPMCSCHCRMLETMLWCVVLTPLAAPVVPEEKQRKARCVLVVEGGMRVSGSGFEWVAKYDAVGVERVDFSPSA